jgi:hypothetical protein
MFGTKISIVRQVVLILLLFVVAQTPARAQTILKTLEPGIAYSQFKQWAIESKFVFEGFTKDSMLVRDSAAQDSHFTRIQIRFCGGDDYAGRASNITIQQLFDATGESSSSNSSNADKLIQMQRDYIEYLSGAADTDGKFTGNFSVRRDHNDRVRYRNSIEPRWKSRVLGSRSVSKGRRVSFTNNSTQRLGLPVEFVTACAGV